MIMDFGHQAPCDSLLKPGQLLEMEKTYPLRLLRCPACGLAQIDHVVAPEELFYPDYPYRSGITETLVKNLQAIASRHIAGLKLPRGGLVVDLGSNDGSILQGFQREGMKVLGVEPTNIAQIAIAHGIPTVQAFFDPQVARDIVQQHGRAVMVTAANMFAHVAKLGQLIRGVEELLTDDGYFLSESHYLLDLLETVQYDSIYHEHLKYYSLQTVSRLLGSYNFTVVDAERIPNYGGSIRVVARKGRGHAVSERLTQLLQAEQAARLDTPAPFHTFRERVLRAKRDLQSLVLQLVSRGERVVGVGCPGRSSTLVNYSNLDPDLMPYIAEQSTSLKLGLFLPGKHIPIVDEKILFEQQPENVLMLSWHYCEPIVRNLRKQGLRSKIIVPLPEVRFHES
jgi:2-polyprenyl-3-methyl-5-hydroxy-6-metoxy-1,4-benzoquinol methylase